MGYRERGSNARSGYLTRDTSRMGPARVWKEAEADTNNCKRGRSRYKYNSRKGRGHEGKSFKKGQTSAEDNPPTIDQTN